MNRAIPSYLNSLLHQIHLNLALKKKNNNLIFTGCIESSRGEAQLFFIGKEKAT